MRDPVDAVFAALADPSRRFVLETLASQGTATPTELAADLPVTRQAVAKHLAALRSAGLVEASRAGRETRYALTPAPLIAIVNMVCPDEEKRAAVRSLGATAVTHIVDLCASATDDCGADARIGAPFKISAIIDAFKDLSAAS